MLSSFLPILSDAVLLAHVVVHAVSVLERGKADRAILPLWNVHALDVSARVLQPLELLTADEAPTASF
jgi:hypothetical protein